MQSSVCIYLWLFAIAAAIVVAAFANRPQNRKLQITLLAAAVAPCLGFAYLTLYALDHYAPVDAGLVGGAISTFGLAFVAVAAKFGRKLSAGWGLVFLIGMASSPPLILLTAAVLYAKAQSAATEPLRRRDLSYPEQLEREKQLASKDRQQRANAKRETMALINCANQLSATAGKAAARRQSRTGSI